MTVARVTEISATSPNSFEDAITEGVTRATKTLRNVKSAMQVGDLIPRTRRDRALIFGTTFLHAGPTVLG